MSKREHRGSTVLPLSHFLSKRCDNVCHWRVAAQSRSSAPDDLQRSLRKNLCSKQITCKLSLEESSCSKQSSYSGILCIIDHFLYIYIYIIYDMYNIVYIISNTIYPISYFPLLAAFQGATRYTLDRRPWAEFFTFAT